MVLADGESSDATLAHSHHPRGPILTLRPTVQGWEGTDLILEWGAERGGSGVEILMDISISPGAKGKSPGGDKWGWYLCMVHQGSKRSVLPKGGSTCYKARVGK